MTDICAAFCSFLVLFLSGHIIPSIMHWNVIILNGNVSLTVPTVNCFIIPNLASFGAGRRDDAEPGPSGAKYRFGSVGTLAVMAQIFWCYYASGVVKTGPEWSTEYDTRHFACNVY
mgnify:CR=1 FL=1